MDLVRLLSRVDIDARVDEKTAGMRPRVPSDVPVRTSLRLERSSLPKASLQAYCLLEC